MNVHRLVPSRQCHVAQGIVKNHWVLHTAFPVNVGASDIIAQLVPMRTTGVRGTLLHAPDISTIAIT